MTATVLPGAATTRGSSGLTRETGPAGGDRVGWGSAALIAAAPFLLHVVQLLLQRPRVVLGGDQAVIEIGVRDAVHLDAAVGPYSHFGWHHPGPAWLYLLAGPYRLLGQASWSLIASLLLLNAACAALIVFAASRLPGRPPQAAWVSWLVALVLLGLQWCLGSDMFSYVWNPNATIMPSVLFLVLCCGAISGRPGWGVGAALVATFLVQTHLGTVVVVGVVGLLVFVTRLVSRGALRWGRLPAPRHPRMLAAAIVAGWLLVALAWVPPLADQVAGTGNLGRISDFLAEQHPAWSWAGSISGAGDLLDRVFLHRAPGRLTPPLHLADATGVPIMVAVLLAGIALIILGRGRSMAAQICGLIAAVALAAAVWAAHGIIGDPGPYLLFWVLAIPVLVGIGWAHLLAACRVRDETAAALLRGGMTAAAFAAGVVVVAGVVARPTAPPPADSAIGRGAALLEQRLAAFPRRAVLVDIAAGSRWLVATGLALELRRGGWPAYVGPAWAEMFGLRPPAGPPPRLTVVVTDVSAAADAPAVRGAESLTPPGSPPLGLYLRQVSG